MMSTNKPTYEELEKRLTEAEEVIQASRDRQSDAAVTGQDVPMSRLKEAEKALRESEEKYTSVIENASIGIIVIQDGKRVFYNSKMHEIPLCESEKTYRTLSSNIPGMIYRSRPPLKFVEVIRSEAAPNGYSK